MPRIRVSEINGVALLLFTLSLLAGIAIAQATRQEAYGIAGAIVGLYFLFAIKIVRQWEKVAVLRLGRYVGLRGPGLCRGRRHASGEQQSASRRWAAVPTASRAARASGPTTETPGGRAGTGSRTVRLNGASRSRRSGSCSW